MSRGDLLEQGRRLLHPRHRGKPPARLPRARPTADAVEKACVQRRAPRGCRRRRPTTTAPAPVSQDQRPRRRRDGGEDRPRREVLKDLPRQRPSRDPPPRAPAGGAPPSRAGAGDSRRGAYSRSSKPVAEAEGLRPPPFAEVADEAGDRVHSGPWSACRNGRGSRFPKKLPVWVIRSGSPGGTRAPRSRRSRTRWRWCARHREGGAPRISSAIASETHEIASARRATRPGELLVRSLPSAGRGRVERRWGLRRAGHGGPRASARRLRTAAPTKWIEPGGEVVMPRRSPRVLRSGSPPVSR